MWSPCSFENLLIFYKCSFNILIAFDQIVNNANCVQSIVIKKRCFVLICICTYERRDHLELFYFIVIMAIGISLSRYYDAIMTQNAAFIRRMGLYMILWKWTCKKYWYELLLISINIRVDRDRFLKWEVTNRGWYISSIIECNWGKFFKFSDTWILFNYHCFSLTTEMLYGFYSFAEQKYSGANVVVIPTRKQVFQ